jgi:hypothetical protein
MWSALDVSGVKLSPVHNTGNLLTLRAELLSKLSPLILWIGLLSTVEWASLTDDQKTFHAKMRVAFLTQYKRRPPTPSRPTCRAGSSARSFLNLSAAYLDERMDSWAEQGAEQEARVFASVIYRNDVDSMGAYTDLFIWRAVQQEGCLYLCSLCFLLLLYFALDPHLFATRWSSPFISHDG